MQLEECGHVSSPGAPGAARCGLQQRAQWQLGRPARLWRLRPRLPACTGAAQRAPQEVRASAAQVQRAVRSTGRRAEMQRRRHRRSGAASGRRGRQWLIYSGRP
ncbi:hypothetical protein ZWY2020_033683 [Hordeum vulgare]|nr:hypothetical protein ZWY2020_033683 [Hordeum vulgare]